ncbi:hypothetical protein [Cysteiniphilum halobium]|uniref:hypothetical protein n=1 Tax=Cysteiniphilum halobium TaxID=2219059 RepID=UPI003F86D921
MYNFDDKSLIYLVSELSFNFKYNETTNGHTYQNDKHANDNYCMTLLRYLIAKYKKQDEISYVVIPFRSVYAGICKTFFSELNRGASWFFITALISLAAVSIFQRFIWQTLNIDHTRFVLSYVFDNLMPFVAAILFAPLFFARSSSKSITKFRKNSFLCFDVLREFGYQEYSLSELELLLSYLKDDFERLKSFDGSALIIGIISVLLSYLIKDEAIVFVIILYTVMFLFVQRAFNVFQLNTICVGIYALEFLILSRDNKHHNFFFKQTWRPNSDQKNLFKRLKALFPSNPSKKRMLKYINESDNNKSDC